MEGGGTGEGGFFMFSIQPVSILSLFFSLNYFLLTLSWELGLGKDAYSD